MKFFASHLIAISLQCVIIGLGDPERIARAQDLDHVTISGRVLDQTGAVIPGATVKAVLTQTGAGRSTETDAQGLYRLIQLPPGTYTLHISSPGFAQQNKKDLNAVAGQSIRIDVTLFLQDLSVAPLTIAVNEVATVDTTRTVVGSTIAAHQLSSLPIYTRSPLDLIFTLPAVSEEPLSTRDLAEDRDTAPASTPEEAGTFSLSGAPAYSNNLTIDGLDNNDDRAARERFQPSLEAIEEVQVITNQFSAEYGRASGGRVNIRTRSGSTQLRGRVFHFFRDEALNANTFRNNSLGLSRLPLQEHVVGFTLGGPLLLPGRKPADRTFFFTTYEFQKVLDSALVDTLVPAERNNVFPLPLPTLLTASRLESADSPALSAEIAPFVSPVSTPLRNTNITAPFRPPDPSLSGPHPRSLALRPGDSQPSFRWLCR